VEKGCSGILHIKYFVPLISNEWKELELILLSLTVSFMCFIFEINFLHYY